MIVTGRNLILLLIGMALLGSMASAASNVEGEVKLGYIYIDETGNLSIYQPTYNLEDGVAVSLENLRYQSAGGLRLHADLTNITLDNRRFSGGLSRSGLLSLNVWGSQYRRTYDFAGHNATRRDQYGGQTWLKPLRFVKVYGGYALIKKEGRQVEWFDPGDIIIPRATDYRQHRYHAGMQLNHNGSMIQAEFRRHDFNDQLNGLNDRQTTRYKVVAVTPLPKFRNIQLNSGFQHFRNALDTSGRRTSANTVWGGGRLFLPDGYSVKYSFIFDRAENSGDIVATDNITQAVSAGKTWRGRGGLSFGYQYKINDDYYDEARTDGLLASGWVMPYPQLALQGRFGMQKEEIKDGATLTGNEDLTRYSFSATYRPKPFTLRVKHENRKRENDDIGSTVDFDRLSADLVFARDALGELTGSYALLQGEFHNSDSQFEFTDHILSGSWRSPLYHRLQAGVEGTYYRSKRDLDVESFSLRLTGSYMFIEGYHLGASYAAHNFDDLLVYDGYYTANIVEIYLSKSL